MLDNLDHDVDTVSRLLVRLLHVRDKRAGRLVAQYGKLTTVLRQFAKRNGERLPEFIILSELFVHL